jgi:hypothetical protein
MRQKIQQIKYNLSRDFEGFRAQVSDIIDHITKTLYSIAIRDKY